MSVHEEQVTSVLKRAIQEVLGRGLSDPRVRGLISVTKLIVSADHANATVMVSVLPEEHAELTMHGLRHAARHIRREAADRVQMRRVPVLSFKLDRSLKREAAVIAAVDKARRVDRDRAGEDPDAGADVEAQPGSDESDRPDSKVEEGGDT